MTAIQFFRLLNKNRYVLLLATVAMAAVTFFYTRSQPAYYETRTEIFTGLTSGNNVASIGGGALNSLMATNQFENLLSLAKSDQTLEEVGERLFAQHLALQTPVKTIMGRQAWENFTERVPKEVRDSLYDPESEDSTLANIRRLKEDYFDSHMVEVLFVGEWSPYSTKAIKKNLTATRIGGSDMIEFTYKWTDPGICRNTLQILNDIFIHRKMKMEIGQTRDVVAYFRKRVEEAREELFQAEDSLTAYRIDNNIINYEEQTENFTEFQNSLEIEYQMERRARAAAQASVDELTEKLKPNMQVIQASEELLTKKRKLADINARIAEMEIYLNNPVKLAELRNEAALLQAELSDNLIRRHEFTKTIDGVPTRDVLQQWLSASIALDASNAKLDILEDRTAIFEEGYQRFSPLGAGISRLQRTVKVAESHYLELNHSLNMALIRQQSESLSTGGLVVAVPPKFPIKPVKEHDWLMVIMAAIIGFVIPLALILGLAFLDNTLRTPVRAEEKTGLKLLGAYPDLDPGAKYKKVDMDWLIDKAKGNMVQHLHSEQHRLNMSNGGKNQHNILVFSTREQEGKTVVIDAIANELAEINKKVAVVSFKDMPTMPEERNYDLYRYEQGKKFLQVHSLEELVPNKESYNYIFLCLSALLTEKYPIELVNEFDMGICVVSAKRAWNEGDKLALQEISTLLRNKPRVALNGVAPDDMDAVVGEIKRTRSAFRRFSKTLLTFQFAKR